MTEHKTNDACGASLSDAGLGSENMRKCDQCHTVHADASGVRWFGQTSARVCVANPECGRAMTEAYNAALEDDDD